MGEASGGTDLSIPSRSPIERVPDPEDRELLERLRADLDHASPRPSQLSVSIRLSQLLGAMRPVRSSHGCEIPLNFDGVPAKTVFGQQREWVFIFDAPEERGAAVTVNTARL